MGRLHTLVLVVSWLLLSRSPVPYTPPPSSVACEAHTPTAPAVACEPTPIESADPWLTTHEWEITDALTAACEAQHEAYRARFGDLVGEKVATRGVAFEREGEFATWEKNDVESLAYISHHDATCGDDPDRWCPGKCVPDPEEDCDALSWRLHDTWGEPLTSELTMWLDAAKQVRATIVYRDEDCELRFSKYVEPRAWIAMTTTAPVPLGLVGGPASRLPKAAQSTYCGWQEGEPDECLTWDIPVTGVYVLRASVTAEVKNGRVRRLLVEGELDNSIYGGADEIHGIARRYLDGPLRMELHTFEDRFELDARPR